MAAEGSIMRYVRFCVCAAAVLFLPVRGQQGPPGSQRPKPLRIQLRLNGLYPPALTVEEGRYELLLENGVFLAQVDFQLDDETGRPLARTNARGKFRGRQRLIVDLRPGRHRLQVVGQPNWKTELTVAPKR